MGFNPRRGGRLQEKPVEIVYCIATEDRQFAKIGFTDGPISRRYKSIQACCPVPLVIIGTIKGSRGIEASLHRRFRQHRTHGEWFHLLPEIESLFTKPAKTAETERRDLLYHN